MPEGPEVRRMGKELATYISGKILTDIQVISGRYTKKIIPGLALAKINFPTRIVGVGVHGKFLYILTSNGINIWSTLGMTGQWSKLQTKHSRVKFCLNHSQFIYFNDQRNFGTIKIVYGPDKLNKKLEKLGPDMFSNEMTTNIFINRLRKKEKWNITKVIMNQSVVSGIGNYIKAESLWLADLSPLRNITDMLDGELAFLYSAVRDIMQTSYKHGGATFLTHKNFSDVPGDYSSRFLCYNRKIDAEGNKVIKTSTPDGRVTHWSPNKQK